MTTTELYNCASCLDCDVTPAMLPFTSHLPVLGTLEANKQLDLGISDARTHQPRLTSALESIEPSHQGLRLQRACSFHHQIRPLTTLRLEKLSMPNKCGSVFGLRLEFKVHGIHVRRLPLQECRACSRSIRHHDLTRQSSLQNMQNAWLCLSF